MKAKRGKLLPFFYYLRGIGRRLLPRPVRRLQRNMLLKDWEKRPDADYIRRRVDFYCRRSFLPNSEAIKAGEVELMDTPSAYIVDIQRYLRAFRFGTRLNYRGGDTPPGTNPRIPTIIRSRRIDDLRDNGVLMNVNHRRHFLNPVDPIPFSEKKPLLFFRGEMEGKPERKRFLELWKDSTLMDVGDTCHPWDAPGHRPPVKLTDHFQYKFILVLEGNDVASSLQWVMRSNCVPVMIRPSVEGWLMHSALEPGVHYIEIASDFSDVEEKIRWAIDHPEECEKISKASTEWTNQFRDKRRENIISYLVLKKYLNMKLSPDA
ncbi:MAG: lipopolysaccharide biosynthesis protein [Muribaculaceae bacterium]|nr:lipopolysaccharide biosynthesis protein [Muribaculaceae bacterium]